MELHAFYKIVMWFINNAQRMLELVNTIVDSAEDIVAHNLAGASAKVENAMAKVIPIAIGFLAGVIGIGNLSKKVGDIIDRVKVPITKAIDWVVEKAVAFADKLGITKMIEKGTKWVKDKVAKVTDKVMGWLGIKKQFKDKSGHEHTLYVTDANEVMVASNPERLAKVLKEARTSENATKIDQAEALGGKLTIASEEAKSAPKEQKDSKEKDAQAIANSIIEILKEVLYGVGTKEKMDNVIVTFDVKGNEEEFKRQLRLQETEINTIQVGNWQTARAKYIAYGRDTKNDTKKERKDALHKILMTNPMKASTTMFEQGAMS